MRNLSENYLQLDIDNGLNERIPFEKALGVKVKNFPNCYVVSQPNWEYIYLEFKNENRIYISKNSDVRLYAIENGYFEGNFCLVENKNGTKLSVIHRNGVLRYPQFSKKLDIESVDDLLDNREIEMTVSTLLNTYDVTKSMQGYEHFCASMPKECIENNEFVDNVLLYFKRQKMEFKNVMDENAINKNYCKDQAEKYFRTLTKTNVIGHCKTIHFQF